MKENDVESWQNAEDERLEYESYCNKIRKGLEDLDEKSGERAFWELIQNARDLSDKSRIKVELTEKSVIFSHHGKPFDYTSFRSLVKQDSSKDRTGADLAGLYGTGFMTTHAFNRLVYVSGPFEVKSGDRKVEGYVPVKDFKLDRSLVDKPEGPKKMKEQLEEVKRFYKLEKSSEIRDDVTSFRYDLKESQVEDVSRQLSRVIHLLPFVLVINSRIEEVEIHDHVSKKHYTLRKTGKPNKIPIENQEWQEVSEEVMLTNHETREQSDLTCKSLQSDKGDVVVIPPFPDFCGLTAHIPSLFLWFPLLGTEDFGVNFIFHSKRFYPVEKRNNIMLPGSTYFKKEYGGKNRDVLEEMTEVLFAYLEKDENAKTLTRQMCEVSFPDTSDDEETGQFYKGMQELWNIHIPSWKILPIDIDKDKEYYAITDAKVKLLHPDFYSQLTSEQRNEYEPVLAYYARLPQKADGQSYLMPSTDLIAWSETVDKWECERDDEFFITVADVCEAIKTKRENLLSFLKLMKDSGRADVMESYALLPNRYGELRKKSQLCHADFMTPEVYELVKEVMGEDSKKIYDPAYLDVCEVNQYSQSDLQKAISSTMQNWRQSVLTKKMTDLTKGQLSALIKFCLSHYQQEFDNARGRMMPFIAEFHDMENKDVTTIRFKDDDNEDFYSTAFNLLLDYTLYKVSKKDKDWVVSNKGWLKSFLNEYRPSSNEAHKKQLDEYGILPNQKNELCLRKDLKKNNGVPSEMAQFYAKIFGKDLHETWVDSDFEDIVELEDNPKDIAIKIERSLEADMKQETSDRKYEKIVRAIILKIAESKEWEEWFGRINEKKASYTFSMKSGEAQKSLFALMDIEDDNLRRLAKLTEKVDIESMLDRMERQQELERENEARFNHLHAIGRHIEDVLRERIGSDLINVELPKGTEDNVVVEDNQYGQDIVVSIKNGEEWIDIFYVEVKSKWDFSEPAHMSTWQVRKAARNPDKYALCCVDLRKHKHEVLENLPTETILACTNVKMNIGGILNPMLKSILEADDCPDDERIKISDYRSNMGAAIFEKGDSLDVLLNAIESKIRSELSNISS